MRLAAGLASVAAFSLAAPPVLGQVKGINYSVSADETLTSNVNLLPSDAAKSDLVTTVTPTLSINETGSRFKITGTASLPILLYARSGADNNKVEPQVALIGSGEIIERLFFLDAAVYVQQEYDSPFGARPISLTTATDNRFTSETYSLTPSFRGERGDYSYLVRDNYDFTNTNGAVASISNARSNELSATTAKRPTPFGWTADYDRSNYQFTDQPSQITQLGRLRAVWEVDPQVEITAGGGYEDNRFALITYKDTIYNAGVRWRPSDRTTLDAFWEHRYFGSSYHVSLDHRRPLSVWSFRATRDTTSYPQQLANLPAGASVSALLNQLLASSFPDPLARQAYIDQLIASGSLPQFTSAPIALFTQQVLLQETETASVALLGVRNTVVLSAYRTRSEPITGSGTPLEGLQSSLTNNTQTGATLTWTHNLSPSLALNASADLLRTVANAPDLGKTNQGDVRVTFTMPISVKTSAYAGARYQRLRSNVVDGYNEAAVFVGVAHTFR